MTGEISQLGRGLRTGFDTDPRYQSIIPPIYPGTNFAFSGLGESPQYEYSRAGNPTRDLLGQAIATLEGGVGAVVTASGLAALTTVFAAMVPQGGRIIAPHDCYGGTWRLLNHLSDRGFCRVDYVNQTDPDALAAALQTPADLCLIETPSNPLLRLVDLEVTVAATRAAGVLTLADNTFCSPVRQRPIEFGCELVLHSTTKFINGHSDVVGGAIVATTDQMTEQISHWANVMGVTGSAFDAWLTLRGLRTLDARVRVHDANAEQLVAALLDHPAVEQVYWPGLPDHPGHQIAARQQASFGSMVSFELSGGADAAQAFCRGLRIFNLAESLGGVESLVAHPASMTHAAMDPATQLAAGISPALLRLSVGIEPVADLLADLTEALDRAVA